MDLARRRARRLDHRRAGDGQVSGLPEGVGCRPILPRRPVTGRSGWLPHDSRAVQRDLQGPIYNPRNLGGGKTSAARRAGASTATSRPGWAGCRRRRASRSSSPTSTARLSVELYAPRGVDAQTPHRRDEVYVVVRGEGWFVNGPDPAPLRPRRPAVRPGRGRAPLRGLHRRPGRLGRLLRARGRRAGGGRDHDRRHPRCRAGGPCRVAPHAASPLGRLPRGPAGPGDGGDPGAATRRRSSSPSGPAAGCAASWRRRSAPGPIGCDSTPVGYIEGWYVDEDVQASGRRAGAWSRPPRRGHGRRAAGRWPPTPSYGTTSATRPTGRWATRRPPGSCSSRRTWDDGRTSRRPGRARLQPPGLGPPGRAGQPLDGAGRPRGGRPCPPGRLADRPDAHQARPRRLVPAAGGARRALPGERGRPAGADPRRRRGERHRLRQQPQATRPGPAASPIGRGWPSRPSWATWPTCRPSPTPGST